MGASLLQWGLALPTGGLSLLPEDTRSRIPLVGPATGAVSDEQKRLEQTQQRLAAEAKQRMEQQRQINMQNTANRLMAFAPLNNHVASRLGPQAAFSPEQMSQFAADPQGAPKPGSPELGAWMRLSDPERAYAMSHRGDKNLTFGGATWGNYNLDQLEQQRMQLMQQQQAEEQRRAMVSGAFQGMPAGPEQIPISAPAPARRF